MVSVVVPVRNGERTIGDCIQSILNADFPTASREIIVVDNGSTDRTPQIIRSYPVTYLLELRRGPSRARNRGIEASRGDILAFTDADCVVTVGWLRTLAAEFGIPEVSGVAGEIVAYPPRTAVERYAARRRPLWQLAALNSARPFAVTANVAFRRSAFAAIGLFDPRFLTGQDQEFSRRFFAAGLRMRYSRAALVFHRHRDTVCRMLKQQFGWGYGAQQLGNYAPRDELTALIRWFWRWASASLARNGQSGNREDAYFVYLEMLRRTARSLGALHCSVSSALPRRLTRRSEAAAARPELALAAAGTVRHERSETRTAGESGALRRPAEESHAARGGEQG